MPSVKFHSANLSLADLRDEVQLVQDQGKDKLVHLQAAKVTGSGSKFNQAQYADVNSISECPELTFIKVDVPANIPSIIADMIAQGRLLIFDELLYISNAEQRVMGFGKV